jgi:hypothetical protein
MAAYWNRPEDSAKTFVDGALRTGDIGYLDEEGYLFLVDRIKDVILCGGYNVYPRVIEDAAYLHPAVEEAIAIGIPDKYRGQSPKLFVKLHEGTSLTAEELKAFLAEQISKIECRARSSFAMRCPRRWWASFPKRNWWKRSACAAKARGSAGRMTGAGRPRPVRPLPRPAGRQGRKGADGHSGSGQPVEGYPPHSAFLRGQGADRAGARGQHAGLFAQGSGADAPDSARQTSGVHDSRDQEFLDLYDADPQHVEQSRLLLKRINERLRLLEKQRDALDETMTELAGLAAETREQIARAEH